MIETSRIRVENKNNRASDINRTVRINVTWESILIIKHLRGRVTYQTSCAEELSEDNFQPTCYSA